MRQQCKTRRISFIPIYLMCLFLIFSHHSSQAQTMDKLSGKHAKIKYFVEPGTPFKVIITDDPADEVNSKGSILFYIGNQIKMNPFHLEKGNTIELEIGPTDKVEKLEIQLIEGAILVDHGNRLKKETEQVKRKIPLPTGSFIADTVMDFKGQISKITKGKVYLKDHIYRYDIIVDKKDARTEEENLTIIVNKKTGKIIFIYPDDKNYFDYEDSHVQVDSPKTFELSDLMNPLYYFNPFEAHYAMSKVYKVIEKGEEKLGKNLCQKLELREEGVLVQTAWISKKHNFPIKLINYQAGKQYMLFEIRNMKETNIAEKTFEIPKGYKLKKP